MPHLENKKYVLWNGGICHIAKFCGKTASSHKISLKSNNRLLNYGQKVFLIWRSSTIL